MIIDKLENAEFYYPLGDRFQKAFEFIKNNDLKNFENGEYEIQDRDVFVSVQDYKTKNKNDAKFEAHKTYADIQLILKGKEQLGFGNILNFSELDTYNPEKDIVFLEGEGMFVQAREGWFLIFLPQDAHMPCISIDESEYVKKAVVKVKI